MAIIKIPTPLRGYTENKHEFSTDAIDVKGAIDALVSRYPQVKQHIINEEGAIRRYLRVFVDHDEIELQNGSNTIVANETQINIIPAIAGGQLK